jgi:aldose sugar dehydrogenase
VPAGKESRFEKNNCMLKKVIFSGLLVLALAADCIAQTDKEQATAVIELYFDGWATSDTIKVSKSMHPTCHLKFYRDSVFRDITKQEYLSRFGKPKEKDKTTITKLEFLDITGNIAQAKTTIETDKGIFTDYFNLIKTNEGWFIVDKISARKDKK